DPTIRDRVYAAQNDFLYNNLQRRILKRPSLIYDMIAALRVDGWNDTLADSFEGELNIWKKQMESQISARTPAFPLPSPGHPTMLRTPGPAANHMTHTIAQPHVPYLVG